MNRKISNFVSLILALSLVLSCVSVCAFAENTADEEFTGFGMEKLLKSEPVFYMDFEEYDNSLGAEPGFERGTGTGRSFPQKIGGKYGTVFSANQGNYIKVLDEEITSGKYILSFDVMHTEPKAGGIGFIRMTQGVPSNESDSKELWGTVWSGKMGYFSNSKGYSVSNGEDAEAGKWYHIMGWLDFDAQTVHWYKDNKFVGSTALSNKATSFWISCDGKTQTNIMSVDNFSLYKVDYALVDELVNIGIQIPEEAKNRLSCVISSDKTANVFTDFEEAVIDVELKNIVEKNIKCDVKYRVVNHTGDVVWENSDDDILIKSQEQKNIKVKPQITKYDRYTIYIECIDSETGDVCCKIDRKFWVVCVPTKGYRNSKYGACIHVSKGKNYTDWDKIKSLIDVSGMGILRDDTNWGQFEEEKGKYGYSDSLVILPFVTENAEMNMDALIVYYPFNNVYDVSYNDRIPRTEESLQAMEKAAENMARQYAGVMNYFEFGNEFDFARQDEMSCKEYATALQYFYRGIKKGNPEAYVVSCCANRSDPDWIAKVMLEGGKGYCDAVSIHNYHGTNMPERYQFVRSCTIVRDKLKELGMEDVELWITEGNGQTDSQVFTEPMQACSLVRIFAQCDAYDLVDRFMFYNIQCQGSEEGEFTNDFGILYPNGTKNEYGPKLAYMAMTNYFARTENAEFKDIIQEENEYLCRYEKSDGSKTLLLYSDDETKTVSLDLNATSGTLYDMYGNSQKLYSEDGKYTFVLTNEPIYFDYSGDNFAKCEDKFRTENVFGVLTVGSSVTTKIKLPDGAKVEIENRDNVDVTVNEKDGICNITTTLKEIPDSTYYWQRSQNYGTAEERDIVDISVTQNGKKIACIPVWIEYLDTQVDITMFAEPYDESNTKYLVGKIKVTNNNSDKTVSGTITMDNEGMKDIVVNDILPGESRDYKVNLPSDTADGGYHLVSGTLKLSDGVEQKFSLGDTPRSYAYRENSGSTMNFLKKVKGEPPVIDGVIDLDEWKDYKITDFDKSQVSYGSQGFMIAGIKENETFGEDADYGGKADFSGSIYSQWDEDFIYVSAIVYDDVHYQKEGPVRYYLDDCFYVTATPSLTQRHDTRIDLALSEFWGDEKSHLYVNWSPLYGEQAGSYVIPEGEDIAQTVVVRKDNVTIYEARIPWHYLIDEEALKNKNFNLSFAIRDYDGDRDKTFSCGGWTCLIDQ